MRLAAVVLLVCTGLAQLADTFVSAPALMFHPGQSVRAIVAALDIARGRFSLALKPSLIGAPDATYALTLFADLESAEALR